MDGPPRRLVVLRHAKSAWPNGVADVERPLADRGMREAPAAGRWLRDHLPAIDLVLCSPAVRARQTWSLVSAELGALPDIHHEARLYGASTEELLALARDLPGGARTVLFVGHNPGLEDFVGLLTGTPHGLKTSAVAVLTGPGPWASAGPGWARLDESATPRA